MRPFPPIIMVGDKTEREVVCWLDSAEPQLNLPPFLCVSVIRSRKGERLASLRDTVISSVGQTISAMYYDALPLTPWSVYLCT